MSNSDENEEVVDYISLGLPYEPKKILVDCNGLELEYTQLLYTFAMEQGLCEVCGAELDSSWRFCPNCGSAIILEMRP